MSAPEEEGKPVEEGGVEVAKTPAPEDAALTGEEDYSLTIGDRIVILGGSLNKTRGRLYGFGVDRMALLVDGSSDRILKIPFVDGIPNPEFGIQAIKPLQKAAVPGFVAMLDLRVGLDVEAFGPEGVPAGVFKVSAVNPEEDSAVFTDKAGEETLVQFGFQEIPRDLGFEVIRAKEAPEPVEEAGGSEAPKLTPVAVEEDDVLEEGDAPGLAERAAEAAAVAAGEEEDFALGEEVELPVFEEIKELKIAERIYPDVFQRSEMLGQLMRLLPEAQRRNPVKLQEIRRLVELMMILRNDVVRYGVTGEPRGRKETSLSTLADLLERPDVPLARKVADIDKILYVDRIPVRENPAPGPLEEEGLHADYWADIIQKAKRLQESMEAGAPEGAAPGTASLPQFYQDMERYRQVVGTPFLIQQGDRVVEKDEEVFRKVTPDLEDPQLNILMPTGNPKNPLKDPVWNPPVVGKGAFATTRILRQRRTRFQTGEQFRTVESGEAPSYGNILVFPRRVARDLGPIRSGSLAQDVSLGMMRQRLLEDILERLGEISDFPTSEGILNIGVKGTLLGNVYIKDWLKNQQMILTGPADALAKLRGYGIQGVEWDLEQSKILAEKAESHLAGLRMFLKKHREENKATLANLKFQPQPLLAAEQSERILKRIKGEPLLQKILERAQAEMGDLAAIDVNWFAYVFLQAPDLLLAVLGQQPAPLAKERLRAIREKFLKGLEVSYAAEKRRREKVQPVLPKPCPHHESLETIEKIGKAREGEPRDVTKMKLLVEALNKYRGEVKEGWVWCNVCSQHLMCEHTLLQIQEFLKPREQEVLHKELLLKFSGGVFGGKFICKVCGQGIADLDFDTNLEFDDEGRPMMGRSVMVDYEGAADQALTNLLEGGGEGGDDAPKFGTETQQTMYKTLKRLAGLMGISPEEEDYRSMIEDFTSYYNTLPTRAQYARAKIAQDYDIWLSLRYVAAAAAVLLVNAQTHMPEYVIYYTSADCKDGFFGYPLEADAKDVRGIQCVASCVANINDNEFPWNMTTLQRQANLVRRRDAILPFIEKRIADMVKLPTTALQIQKKREYRAALYGSEKEGKRLDSLPLAFRPAPFLVSVEEAAGEGVVAAAAGPSQQATAWIRTAHRVALKNAPLAPDSVQSGITCCLHPVVEPQSFWSKQEMPPLEPRTAGVGAFRSASLRPTFSTAAPKAVEGAMDPKDYWKLFAELCYRGDNKGLPHKLNLGLTCSECGLIFPRNPNLPFSVETNDKKHAEETAKGAAELQASITGQGIEISEETFTELSTQAHLKTAVSKDERGAIPRPENTFTRLAALTGLQPVKNWVAILGGIQAALREIGEGATEIQIAEAASELVGAVAVKEEFLKERLGELTFMQIEALLRRPPREVGEALGAYVLVPFQRWLTNLDANSFMIMESYGLSEETAKVIRSEGLGQHLTPFGTQEALRGISRRKVRHLVSQLGTSCREIFPSLRPLLTPGGKTMVEYLVRAYVIGIFEIFLNPHVVPEGDEEIEEGAVANLQALYQSLAMAMRRLTVTSRMPSEEEIRLKLEARVEAENQKFIRDRKVMTADMKKADRMNQALGLGRFAVGGSAAIRKYDADRWEAERAERAVVGLVDYADLNAPDVPAAPVETDIFGFAVAAEDEDFAGAVGAGTGYDVVQIDTDYTEDFDFSGAIRCGSS